MANISSYLSLENIILELPPEPKEQIIRRLCDLVAQNQRLEVQELYEAVLGRERLGSTALGLGVALPHGRTAKITRTILAFGRIRPGAGPDGFDQTINLVFLLLVPECAAGEHLAVLSTLGRLLSRAPIRAKLLAAESPERILEILKSETANEPRPC